MASMSYCVIENVCDDLPMVLSKLRELINDGERINKYEQQHLASAIESMREIIDIYEEGIANNVIDAHGRLIETDDDDEE